MLRITYYCDGCGAELSVDEADASRQTAYAHVTEDASAKFNYSGMLLENSFSVPLISELFCKHCISRAKEWWDDKFDFINDLVVEMNKRLLRGRTGFFGARPKPVKHKITEAVVN